MSRLCNRKQADKQEKPELERANFIWGTCQTIVSLTLCKTRGPALYILVSIKILHSVEKERRTSHTDPDIATRSLLCNTDGTQPRVAADHDILGQDFEEEEKQLVFFPQI